jgi:phosphohistidine phosphatase
MRTLLVMRHGKSDWGEPGPADHDRPLAPRGLAAAARMGSFLTEAGLEPHLILSSTALRAVGTAEHAAKAGGWGSRIVPVAALYASDPGRVLDVLRETDPQVERLLVTGHEPTWSQLVSLLMGGGRLRMPTAAVACLDLEHGDWGDLAAGSCILRWLVVPKALG